MSRKKKFIIGTFILTLTGIISRIIGFAYRIFISKTFGAEALGLYQLIFPIYALCYAFSTAGIETAIARTVASKIALDQKKESKSFLLSSMILSLFLSCLCTVILHQYALQISTYFLQDIRTYQLILLLSYAFPFASIHGCVIGYYLGLKQTTIPAIAQLLEQSSRVISVMLIYYIYTSQQISCDISIAVIGLIIGEIVSSVFVIFYVTQKKESVFNIPLPLHSFSKNLRELLPHATPLTANRVTLNILHSIEAVSLPLMLQAFGLSTSEALSTYGALIGMALPCLLFPTALTSSISAMLLPTVSEIQARNNKKEIRLVVSKTIQSCTLLGFTCLISFFIFSDTIGLLLFNNAQVGSFLKVLAWLCPFMYLNTTLLAIMNGLGKPLTTFFLNVTSLFIRIGCIYCLIPNIGIYGYLFGLLISQIFITIGSLTTFRKLCIV